MFWAKAATASVESRSFQLSMRVRELWGSTMGTLESSRILADISRSIGGRSTLPSSSVSSGGDEGAESRSVMRMTWLVESSKWTVGEDIEMSRY